jgi:predicted nucleotidyltransferase
MVMATVKERVSMVLHKIEISPTQVADFCRRHQIRRLALFGSILREDFGPESDVDVLVDFEPGLTPSLLGMAGLEIELSEMFGRKVDLRTKEDLSRYFRDDVLKSAVIQYDSQK